MVRGLGEPDPMAKARLGRSGGTPEAIQRNDPRLAEAFDRLGLEISGRSASPIFTAENYESSEV